MPPIDDTVERLCGDLSAIRAPRGTGLTARSWLTEAPLRMLLNNLDAEVAERPAELMVYGGTGKAARSALNVAPFEPDTLLSTVLHQDQWPRVWREVRSSVGD
mgnify:CR=1 FL=1